MKVSCFLFFFLTRQHLFHLRFYAFVRMVYIHHDVSGLAWKPQEPRYAISPTLTPYLRFSSSSGISTQLRAINHEFMIDRPVHARGKTQDTCSWIFVAKRQYSGTLFTRGNMERTIPRIRKIQSTNYSALKPCGFVRCIQVFLYCPFVSYLERILSRPHPPQ